MRLPALAACVAVLFALEPAAAWEGETTHAGLTEQAALHSRLHQRLRDQLGVDQGLFAPLIVPPADAGALFDLLRTFNPTHGYVPDSRGRMLALGWLAAGAVLADVPAAHAAHHFFDPLTGRGLSDQSIEGASEWLRQRIYPRLAGEPLPRSGKPAPAWVLDPQNPMGVAGFIDQYAKAVSSRTPGERSRHVAGALLAAGAILHVLQDMGSPSHVRDDLAAHLDTIGRDALDVGSRFERVAALAYGRLGVPAPDREVTAASLRAFFTGTDGSGARSGLADRTSGLWFSAHTLPRPISIQPGIGQSQLGGLLRDSLVRPQPAPLPRLDLEAARTRTARLVNDAGVCVANYRLDDRGTLTWFLDDACMAEQLAVILPEVAAYSRGLLDWLFRGGIALQRSEQGMAAVATGIGFGAGTLTLFWDDGSGVRTSYGTPIQVTRAEAGAVLGQLPAPPQGARAVALLFRGVDASGEPMVAAGYVKLGAAAEQPAAPAQSAQPAGPTPAP